MKEERKSQYKIQGWNNQILNIPTDFQKIGKYSATLGHKANHARNGNAEFHFINHPRFGEIVGVFMTENAAAGDEVLVDYGYIEKYQATEAGINIMLETAQAMSGISDKKEFKTKMKTAIKYVREKVEDLKPFLNILNMVR